MLRDDSKTVDCSSSVLHLSSLKAAVFFLDYVLRDRSVGVQMKMFYVQVFKLV
jgi:hypothetical protein